MPASNREPGRALLYVVLAVVVAAVVGLIVVADPFGTGDAIERGDVAEETGDLRTEGAGADPAAELDVEAGGLAGRYGAGDLGAVRLRVLSVSDRLPIADLGVRLIPRTGGGRETTSDGGGVAAFTSVAPSRGYRVEITGANLAHVSIQGVTVRRGETTDLGDIVLGANVVLRGRVIDGTGRPLPGTSVSVYTPGRSMISDGFIFNMVEQATNFPAPVEQVLTDDQGWFTLVSLTGGSYRLEARQGGYATRYETDVVVSEERPARDMTIVLGEGATVAGKVVDEVGKPIAGARVVALKDMGRRFFGASTLERDVALTDVGGSYALDTLTLGTTYRLGVIAEGYAPIFEMSGVELMDKVQKKDFQLVRGGSIVGRVLRKDNAEPVAGAQVVVAVGRMFGGRRGGGGEEQKAGTGRATTGEDGTFRIENLMPGPVMSGQVKSSGYVTFTASMWTGNGWSDVEPGGEVEVLVELEPGGSVAGTVTDAKTNAAIPYAEVTVLPRGNPMRAMFTGSPSAQADAQGKFTVSGVQPGEYGVIAIAPGYAASDANSDDTRFTISEEGGLVSRDVALKAAGRVVGVVRDSQGEPVAGARVRSRLAPQPRTEGGGRGGRGGRGGQMAGMLPGGSGADLSDQLGRFIIDDVGSDQRWILEAEADDFVATESEPFQVAPGDTKEVDLVLSGGGNLEGRVVDDRGGFVAGVRVQVGHIPADRATQRLSAWEVDRYLEPRVHFTDEDGKFRAENLRPGITVVKAEREGYVTFYKRNVVMRADETIDGYTVAMTRGDVMEGKVFGSTGRALEGAMVAVTKRAPGDEGEDAAEADEEIEPRLSARTDADGRFKIENIPPGMYSVVVWFAQGHQGWARDQNEKAIRRGIASASTTVEFRLEAAVQGGGGFGPGGNRGGGGNQGRGGSNQGGGNR
jgi:protocatechuate 3,4-dioxygenase beta subunit